MIRLMYASNAPWCFSGYGVQGRSLLPRLMKLPEVEDIAIFAWFGLQGGMLNAGDMPIYPKGLDTYGNDMYGAHCQHFNANLLITLIDAWVLKPETWELPEGVRWAPWYPVDHDPIPENVADVVGSADYPLTYAKFGRDASDAVGIDNTYIPHGVETNVFKVLPDDEVAEFRADVCEDAEYLAVMVAANKGWPSRKGFEESLTAFKAMLPELPEKSLLYIHADYTKATSGGDLAGLVNAMGLREHVRFPNRYKMWIGGYGADYMALMYNAADVFLSPSKGEGFGIPIIEAQACGCPVIVTDFSSMPELVHWGYSVPVHSLQWTFMDTYQAAPSVPAIGDAMMHLWDECRTLTPNQLAQVRQETSQLIHDEYGWDTLVADYWQPFLRRVLEDNEQWQSIQEPAAVSFGQPQMVQPEPLLAS